MKETNTTREHSLQKHLLCSVCIATYRRPQLLKNLLHSLKCQSLPDHVNLEIIVVDNDLKKSAELVVDQFSDSEKVKFYYYTQPKKNISLTRNLAVKKAAGKYILFIDDDETANHEWVKHLLNTIKKYDADGVFGYVEPEFNDQTPDWMRRRDLFFYGPIGETGTETKATYTNNCMIKGSLLKEMEQPFDPYYGITGGEDIQLFRKLAFEGAWFVYCREAIVTEFLPVNRTRLPYFFHRSLRGGNTHTRWLIESSRYQKLLVKFFMLLKSICYGFVSLLALVIMFPNKIIRIKWLVKFASNLGRFMAVFGWYYEGYR